MKHLIDDEDKNKYEALDKQEVISLVQEMISSGELPEEINGLVITLKNPIDNLGYKIAFCTQAKYNELDVAGQLETNCYYFITDDNSYENLIAAIEEIQDDVESATERVNSLQEDLENGEIRVGKAQSVKNYEDEDGVEYNIDETFIELQRYEHFVEYINRPSANTRNGIVYLRFITTSPNPITTIENFQTILRDILGNGNSDDIQATGMVKVDNVAYPVVAFSLNKYNNQEHGVFTYMKAQEMAAFSVTYNFESNDVVKDKVHQII